MHQGQWKDRGHWHVQTFWGKLLFQAYVKRMRRGCNELQNNHCFCPRGPWAVLYLLEIVYVCKSCDHGAMISGCWQCDSKGRHESPLLHVGESSALPPRWTSFSRFCLSSGDFVLWDRMGKELGTEEGWNAPFLRNSTSPHNSHHSGNYNFNLCLTANLLSSKLNSPKDPPLHFWNGSINRNIRFSLFPDFSTSRTQEWQQSKEGKSNNGNLPKFLGIIHQWIWLDDWVIINMSWH